MSERKGTQQEGPVQINGFAQCMLGSRILSMPNSLVQVCDVPLPHESAPSLSPWRCQLAMGQEKC